MQVVRRSVRPGEIDYELVWLCVTIVSLAMAVVWFALRLPWPHCMFLEITGHPCVTCGATRATIAFFHLDFRTAWRWNPLVFGFLCGVSIFDTYAFAVLITRAPRLRVVDFTSKQKRFFRIVVIALLLSNWLYLLSRPASLF
jgi:Protein of unknown function (DUF2752)